MKWFVAFVLLLLVGFPASASLFPIFQAVNNGVVTPVAPTVTVTPTACASPTVGVSCAGFAGLATGTPTPTSTFQWRSNPTTCISTSTAISGATSVSYTPVSGDVGSVLCMTVTWTNSAGTAAATTSQTGAVAAAPTNPTFTALHTYFISPTGSGSTCSSASPCATPNAHASVCGDVWIARAGAYATSWSSGLSAQPTTCPSTSGGIDGTGGIYFATVVCETAFACNMASTVTTGGSMLQVTANNWSVQGFVFSATNKHGIRGPSPYSCATSTTVIHHIAWINDISYQNDQSFGNNDCALNENVPGNGTDYWAVIGSIAEEGVADSICLGAIDAVGMANIDTNAGTHVMLAGNFSYQNQSTLCTNSDKEGLMFDTLDSHGVVGTYVAQDNMIWTSAWAAIQIFQQSNNSSAPIVDILHNTTFANEQNSIFTTGATGEINGATLGGFPWVVTIQNNISLANVATVGGGGGGPVFAYSTGGTLGSNNWTVGGTSGQTNIFKAVGSSCPDTCNSGDDVRAGNGYSFGTNTYTNPLFNNTTDLLANWITPPNCSGKSDVAACMGWNYTGQTATANTPIYDLIPTAAAASGKGYRAPGACAADSNWPAWLKGVVYLVWNGTGLTENAGLVQKPCNV